MFDLLFFWRQQSWLRNALFFALAGMEMSWLAPIAISLNRRSWQSPDVLFLGGLLVVLVVLMLVANFLALRQIDSPLFELAVLGTIIVLSLLVVRLYVFAGEPLFSTRWLGVFFAAEDPRRLEAFWVLGLMAYLWWRGITFLQREVGFFVIGLDFRKGVLGLIAGVALYASLVQRTPTLFIYAFFFFSLLAVALGRVEDKMRVRGDAGAGPAPAWLALLAAASGGVLLLAAVVHRFWSLRGLGRVADTLRPAAVWLFRLLEPLILFLLSLLEPLFQWFIHFIQSQLGPEAENQPLIKTPPSAAELFGQENGVLPGSQVPLWFIILFRYVIPGLIIAAVLLVLVLWLDRRRKVRRGQQAYEERESLPKDERQGLGDVLRDGWQRLRGLGQVLGRYGLGRRFYAALSVRHLYANLQQLAARRGYPRARAQTPNDYLPTLLRAFPGQEEALQQLTAAYNAVEYGHVPTDEEALQRLRAAWEGIARFAREHPPA